MKNISLKASGWFITLLIIGLFIHGLGYISPQSEPQVHVPTIGNVRALETAYTQWKKQKVRSGNNHFLNLGLHYIKGVSSEYTQATGTATLDLSSGALVVNIQGLPNGHSYDMWFIDSRKRAESFTLSESSNAVIRLGSLQSDEGSVQLTVKLKVQDYSGLQLDHLVVTRSGEDPDDYTLLSGSPTLFQRLYFQEQRGQARFAIPVSRDVPLTAQPEMLAFLIPAAHAQSTGGTLNLAGLIAEGENLFFNETFDGNGRTCGTCHRAENNFTIDPDFIASLPSDDPLFVAEFNTDLTELEDPILLRQFGLNRVNIDGFEDPANKFVMRSVQHILGMSLSIQSVATNPPLDMTGWSGDGSPGNGTLREFATGAVTQHFPKTLNRIPGEDFRLPTDAELDAIEAFTLSLGRQNEMNFETMQLTDENAEQGRVLFITEDSQNQTVQAAKCNICHRNGGALTVAGVNQNFDTGIENILHPAALAGQPLPRDDGFGTQLNTSTGGFGDGTFNTTSIIEAADTAPYFHHNGATTLEDAIAFYGSNEFRNSIEGQQLLLQDSGGQEMDIEVDALAAFLRVINALDNIRAVADFLDRAKLGATVADSQNLLNLAQADINDAIEVLDQSELHKEDAIPLLEQTQSLADDAANAGSVSERDDFIDQAILEAQTAKAIMVVDSGPDTTNPTVSVVSPLAGNSVTGLVTISADALDDVGIDTVIFTVGSTEIGRDFSSPFEQAWDTALFPEGANQITVTAIDSSGNGQSATATVTVSHAPPPDTTNPTVTVTAPGNGTTVSGTITITADASDDVGVDRVIFTVGSIQIGQDTTAPFEQVFDTATISNSSVQISATAVDTSGNSSLANVTVTVSNAPPQCTVYSCPNPPPPPTTPPPPPTIPNGSSPDGEFEGEVISKDVNASTVTVTTGGGSLTLKITSTTNFKGSIALDFHSILVGHVVQGEFFTSVGEALWIEADLP